jgi:hypothetical protein
MDTQSNWTKYQKKLFGGDDTSAPYFPRLSVPRAGVKRRPCKALDAPREVSTLEQTQAQEVQNNQQLTRRRRFEEDRPDPEKTS